MTWMAEDVVHVVKYHRVPCLFAMGLLFFMGVEYTLHMAPSSSEPFDLGFIATRSLHCVLSTSPELNTFLAFLNTGLIIERIQAEPVEGKRKLIYLWDGKGDYCPSLKLADFCNIWTCHGGNSRHKLLSCGP